MRKPVKALLLAIIVAFLPMRGMAALMAGSCGFGEEQIVTAQSIFHAQDSQAASGTADTHCPAAVFLTSAVSAPVPLPSDEREIALVEHSAPPFFPEKLDRPPLAVR